MALSLKREVQVGCVLQSDEATPAVSGTTAMAVGAYSRELAEDPTYTINALSYERGSRKGSLSKSGKLLGPGLLEVGWKQELSGGGPLTADSASWYDAMRACGFAAPTILKKVTIDGASTVGATSGGSKVFKFGDRIGDNATEGSATKTGTVVYHHIVPAVNAEILVYIAGTGTFANTDTIHNYSQAGQNSPCDSAPTDAGKRWKPQSNGAGVTPSVATAEVRIDGKIWRAISARGNMKFMFEHGKPAMAEFTFRGPWDRLSTGGPQVAGLVASVPVPPKPLLVGEVGWPFTLGAYAPILTKADLDMGNQLTDRPTISEAGIVVAGSPVGYMATVIADRRPVLTIDPESVPAATFDYVGKWQTEQTFAYLQRTGIPSDPSGALIVYCPAAQFDNDTWQQGDRNGIVTENPSILATGSADDEIEIYHVFV